MVRPAASEENKRIGLMFAKMVIARIREGECAERECAAAHYFPSTLVDGRGAATVAPVSADIGCCCCAVVPCRVCGGGGCGGGAVWVGGCSQVTTSVESEECPVVARTGKWSIFCALQECCPSAVRNDDPFIGKYGMTEIELNKVLEKNSFIKIRDRSSGIVDEKVAESNPPFPLARNVVSHCPLLLMVCPGLSYFVRCNDAVRGQMLCPLPFLKHAVEKPARVARRI